MALGYVHALYVRIELQVAVISAAPWLKFFTTCGDMPSKPFHTGLERVNLTVFVSRYLHYLSSESSISKFHSRQVYIEPEHQSSLPAARSHNTSPITTSLSGYQP